jgi:voltage-gated sodium channel
VVRLAARLIASPRFERAILLVILANAGVLAAETYDGVERRHGALLDTLNAVFLGVFVLELLVRFTAAGWNPRRFFGNGWNAFDFVVVSAAFVPGLRENATLLRLARLLRIVRAVRLLPDLRVLVAAVGRALPGVGSLALLTVLILFVYGMLGWLVFAEHDPERWGDIGDAMLTLFVMLSLENLPENLERGRALSEWAVLYYVSFALVAAFVLFNLFIGIVINSMEEARAIELTRAERELRDDDPSNDERAHDVVLGERLRALRGALDDVEREIAARDADRGRSP